MQSVADLSVLFYFYFYYLWNIIVVGFLVNKLQGNNSDTFERMSVKN